MILFLAKVGDDRFFQYILDALNGIYPKRDYNRAIEIPSKELGAKHEEPLALIDARVKDVIGPESEKIKEELSHVEGFIDVNKKHDEIKKRLSKTLTNDPDYEDFTNKLNKLVESHPFFNNNNDNDSKTGGGN